MGYLFLGVPVLFGFVLGFFLTKPAIVAISVAVFIILIVFRQKGEIESPIGNIVWTNLLLGLVMMLGMHMFVVETDIGIPDFVQYIFRK